MITHNARIHQCFYCLRGFPTLSAAVNHIELGNCYWDAPELFYEFCAEHNTWQRYMNPTIRPDVLDSSPSALLAQEWGSRYHIFEYCSPIWSLIGVMTI
ncbi:hypothetical protein LTR28_005386 [Elasticomyces elasticus]|nr:hypothetical protein LTR28_005386 [Elasticomyces elasticus]